MKNVKTERGKSYRLGQLLGGGGEGNVYETENGMCIKIYNDNVLQQKRDQIEDKISLMIQNPPQITSVNVRVCWPKEKVYDRGKFVGFVMSKAFDASVTLYELIPTNFETNHHIAHAFIKTFTRSTEEGLINRMKIIINMASAYHTITQAGRYHIVDMKHDNILVDERARVSIVDCDSFEVNIGNKKFDAPMVTMNYTPPEYYTGNKTSKIEWDYFVFAVLVYELLMGIHPFAATFKAPHDDGSISYNIQHQLFVHQLPTGVDLYQPLNVSHPHQKYLCLPYEYQNLFIRSFLSQSRPSIEEYGKIFFKTVNMYIKKNDKRKMSMSDARSFVKSFIRRFI